MNDGGGPRIEANNPYASPQTEPTPLHRSWHAKDLLKMFGLCALSLFTAGGGVNSARLGLSFWAREDFYERLFYGSTSFGLAAIQFSGALLFLAKALKLRNAGN